MSELEKRPSKKQHEVLDYVDTFIRDNGFGPTYREIMKGLGYKSVSTVATHVDSLIVRGLLSKNHNSARSLQIVADTNEAITETNSLQQHLAWLRSELAKREADIERSKDAAILKAALTLLDQSGKN